MGELIDSLKDKMGDSAYAAEKKAVERAEKLGAKIGEPLGKLKGDPLGSVGGVAKKGWRFTGGATLKAAKWAAIAGVGLVALNALFSGKKKSAAPAEKGEDLATTAASLPPVDVPAQAVLPPMQPTLMGEAPQPGQWAARVRGGGLDEPAYQPPALDGDLASRVGDVSTQPSRA